MTNSVYTNNEIDLFTSGNLDTNEVECIAKFSFNRLSTFNEPIYFILRLENLTEKSMNDIHIEFDENPYFQRKIINIGSVMFNNTLKTEISLETKQNVYLKELAMSSIINFKIYSNYSNESNESKTLIRCAQNILHLISQIFMKEFFTFNTDIIYFEGIRLALFGPVGFGKSAFINTLFHFFSKNNENKPAKSGNKSGYLTNKIKTYNINSFLDNNFNYSISIKDVWGIQLTIHRSIEFNEEIMNHILNGYLENGFNGLNIPIKLDKSSQSSSLSSYLSNLNKTYYNPKEKVDIAILIIGLGNLNSQSLNEIENYCKYLTDNGREYIVIITFTDFITPMNDYIKMIFDPNFNVRKETLQLFSNRGLDPNKIFFISNKLNWEENENEYIFSNQISIIQIFIYLFTNYSHFMKSLMSKEIEN